jgi:diadenosine tetraphosphatase ApaH/serine/threonine PP2A family protein phosphatase
MRYAVLSDIHGNLEALEAVLADTGPRVDAILCLGDIVGYGADPGPCVELLGERAGRLVAGNHEHGVTGRLGLDWFNRWARTAAEWTRDQLDDDHCAFLARLPLRAEVDEATLVHASPDRPDEWEYLVSAEDGHDVFGAFQTRLCFVGHSHVPGVWSEGAAGRDHRSGAVDVELEAGRRYLVNVGSVGQPRDRDTRAAWVLWDAGARRVSLRRVAYDVERARRKILASGLPRYLADRLAVGA